MDDFVQKSPDILLEEGSDDGDSKRVKRTVFSRKQLKAMEARFVEQTFLSKEERRELAEELGLTERQIMVWFQNRRGRLKKRGPADVAYSAEKLDELNSRRPYPFLYGLLSSMQFRYGHPHPYQHLCESGNDNTLKTGPLGPTNLITPWNQEQSSNSSCTTSPPNRDGFSNSGNQTKNIAASPPQQIMPGYPGHNERIGWPTGITQKCGIYPGIYPETSNLDKTATTQQGRYHPEIIESKPGLFMRNSLGPVGSDASTLGSCVKGSDQSVNASVDDCSNIGGHGNFSHCPGDIMVVSTTHAVRIEKSNTSSSELSSTSFAPVQQNSSSCGPSSRTGINLQYSAHQQNKPVTGVGQQNHFMSDPGSSYARASGLNCTGPPNITIENKVHVTARNHRYNPYSRHAAGSAVKFSGTHNAKTENYRSHASVTECSPLATGSCSQYPKPTYQPHGNLEKTSCSGSYYPDTFNLANSSVCATDSQLYSGYLPENFTFEIPDISNEYGSTVIAGDQRNYLAAQQNCAFALH